MYFKVVPKGWSSSSFFLDLPWMDQMGYTAILSMIVIILVSLLQHRGADDAKGITLQRICSKHHLNSILEHSPL